LAVKEGRARTAPQSERPARRISNQTNQRMGKKKISVKNYWNLPTRLRRRNERKNFHASTTWSRKPLQLGPWKHELAKKLTTGDQNPNGREKRERCDRDISACLKKKRAFGESERMRKAANAFRAGRGRLDENETTKEAK